ncbi:MAG TPA: TIGR00296 family protein [Nitrososphaeraceae archaeon]|nr:TIGR00296 family protein [Nitrososphaeraceae archaeon]
MIIISDKDGEKLVRLARQAVKKYLDKSTIILPIDQDQLSQEAGVFVTLYYLGKNKEEHLRGCIGFPIPEKKLYQSVIEAAINAATQDPRFSSVGRDELANIIFEVSVLSSPEKIKAQDATDYKNHIKIGRDGLILKWKYGSGLLLPQVAMELNWDIDEYLTNICYKANAPPDIWLMPESQLYKFEAMVYKETEPNGKILKVI